MMVGLTDYGAILAPIGTAAAQAIAVAVPIGLAVLLPGWMAYKALRIMKRMMGEPDDGWIEASHQDWYADADGNPYGDG